MQSSVLNSSSDLTDHRLSTDSSCIALHDVGSNVMQKINAGFTIGSSQWWDSNFSSAGSITEVIYYLPVLFQLMMQVYAAMLTGSLF